MDKFKDLIWTEKYRATSFDDLVLKDKDKEYIQSLLSEPKKLPSFLFYSFKPGTDKTTTAYLIIRILECDKLILNASDERGIDTIRDKVTNFTKTMSLNPGIKRCVFLDEADYLTTQAQATLRNLIEETSNNSFFILTANAKEKIIEPLRSRTINIDFNNPPKEQIYNRLEEIASEENIELKVLDKLVELYYPDIRKMVLILQGAKQGYSLDEILITENKFKEFFNDLKTGQYNKLKQVILDEEINIKEFMDWLFTKISESNNSFDKLGKLCKVLINIEKYLIYGINPKIILLAYIGDIHSCLS